MSGTARVGLPATVAVAAGRMAPGLLGRYLARTGCDAATDRRAGAPGPPSLRVPPDGTGDRDHGAHGAFDDEAAAGATVLPVRAVRRSRAERR
ncbi:hypothetical protein ACFY7C_02705 [Streptomyces sp. NPDC012769]|uniref:hypothetical protein n=1 Tax=Streptomyces sp. NPDC012769 TaxID=3364848 RepID=UPI003675DA12